jgi:hypothetical protein
MRDACNLGFTLLLSVALVACANNDPNKAAMRIGAPPDGAVKLRSLETRRYDTLDEKSVLLAGTQTLQDLGFTITESASEVGVLVASKQRDAEETKQVIGAIAMAVLFGAANATWDKDQTINVTLVTTPVTNSKQVEVRVAFDRVIRNNKEQSRAELLMDPSMYQQFFDKLSSGVLLEAHEI